MEFLKKTAINYLYLLGIWQVFHCLARHKTTIIYVHGMMDVHQNSEWIPLRNQVSPKELEHCLCILNKEYTFISLSQATKILTGEAPPVKNGLVLTLDDGYLNNLKYGSPLFKKFGIQPCLFISTKIQNIARLFGLTG